jgi:hypothetical protein
MKDAQVELIERNRFIIYEFYADANSYNTDDQVKRELVIIDVT